MMQVALLMVALVAGVSAQFFPHQEPVSAQFFPHQELSFAIQPPPVQQAFVAPQQHVFARQPQGFAPQQNYAHRAVVQNAEREAQLPPHLLNPFYKNQRIAGALAKESWFTPGENLVVDREAEKIPRQRIYTVLKNAGFINRRRR